MANQRSEFKQFLGGYLFVDQHEDFIQTAARVGMTHTQALSEAVTLFIEAHQKASPASLRSKKGPATAPKPHRGGRRSPKNKA